MRATTSSPMIELSCQYTTALENLLTRKPALDSLNGFHSSLLTSPHSASTYVTALGESISNLSRHLGRVEFIRKHDPMSLRSLLNYWLVAPKTDIVIQDLIRIGGLLGLSNGVKEPVLDKSPLFQNACSFIQYIVGNWVGRQGIEHYVRHGESLDDVLSTYCEDLLTRTCILESDRVRLHAARILKNIDSKTYDRILSQCELTFTRKYKNVCNLEAKLIRRIIPTNTHPKIQQWQEKLARFSERTGIRSPLGRYYVAVDRPESTKYNIDPTQAVNFTFVDRTTIDNHGDDIKQVLEIAKTLRADHSSKKLRYEGGITVPLTEELLRKLLEPNGSELLIVKRTQSNEVVGISIFHKNEEQMPSLAREVIDNLPPIGRKGFLTFIGVASHLEGLERIIISHLCYALTELSLAHVHIVGSKIATTNIRSQYANIWDSHRPIGITGRISTREGVDSTGKKQIQEFYHCIRFIYPGLRSWYLHWKWPKPQRASTKVDRVYDSFKENLQKKVHELEQLIHLGNKDALQQCYKELKLVLEDFFYSCPESVITRPEIAVRGSSRTEFHLTRADLRIENGVEIEGALEDVLDKVREEFDLVSSSGRQNGLS